MKNYKKINKLVKNNLCSAMIKIKFMQILIQWWIVELIKYMVNNKWWWTYHSLTFKYNHLYLINMDIKYKTKLSNYQLLINLINSIINKTYLTITNHSLCK